MPALPERISRTVTRELNHIGVTLHVGTMVTEAQAGGFKTKDGGWIPADLKVWAAGIKAPEFLADIGGLETNRINQLKVNAYLQTSRDERIFALGDCAEFIQENGKPVPPRAQSAHQMASACYHNLVAVSKRKRMKVYCYKDSGSLVTLANYSTVGSLMGNLSRGRVFLEGRIARMVYISLYRMHQIALHGLIKTGLLVLVRRINHWLRPRLKLH